MSDSQTIPVNPDESTPSTDKRPRMHHFLPASFLRRFADADGFLHVWDMLDNRVFKSKPENAARERDFYTVATTRSPADDSTERLIAGIEAKASPVIDWIVQNNRIPQGDDLVNLAVFVGLLDQRTPLARRMCDETDKAFQRFCARQLFGNRDSFEKGMKQYREATGDDREFTFEDAQEVLESEAYLRDAHQNQHIRTMLQLSMSLAFTVGQMTMHLLISQNADFITGDCPLPQFNRLKPEAYAAGWKNLAVQVGFPISRTRCLVFSWDAEPVIVPADDLEVANSNLQIAQKSQRYTFAPSDAFLWMRRDESVSSDRDELHRQIGPFKKDFKTLEFLGGMAPPVNQAGGVAVGEKETIAEYMRLLASGTDVTVDARQFTPAKIRQIGSATVYSTSGWLTITSFSNLSPEDQRAALAVTPGKDQNGKPFLPRIRHDG